MSNESNFINREITIKIHLEVNAYSQSIVDQNSVFTVNYNVECPDYTSQIVK